METAKRQQENDDTFFYQEFFCVWKEVKAKPYNKKKRKTYMDDGRVKKVKKTTFFLLLPAQKIRFTFELNASFLLK